MLKIERWVGPSPEQWDFLIKGMRNPKNSWDKSDSWTESPVDYFVGPNDQKLMESLASGGPVHAKYRRMIVVYMDIVAPLYWWKEFDTYKVGTVCNSCSTMHKIHAKEFTLEDFSCERLYSTGGKTFEAMDLLAEIIHTLNFNREKFIETGDKMHWDQMIQLLPTSYNQKRTVMLNYEVLVNIYKWRRNHKLGEWHTFCDWIEQLPYSELITGKYEKTTEATDDILPA